MEDPGGMLEGESGHEEGSKTITWNQYADQSPAIERSHEGEIDAFLQWDFDCLQLSHDELIHIAWKPFAVCEIEEQCRIPHDRLLEFIKVVQYHYHKENP